MNEPTQKTILEAARRRLKMHIVSTITRIMAETDVTIDTLAERLGKKPKEVHHWFRGLMDDTEVSLSDVVEMAMVLDCDLHVAFVLAPEEPEENAMSSIFTALLSSIRSGRSGTIMIPIEPSTEDAAAADAAG